jgi:hypothetical protein
VKNLDPAVESEAHIASAMPDEALTSRIRAVAWCALPLAGLIDALASRHTMQDDGISYLDLGDAMMRGDWKAAVNGVWSPLYPFLQGLALKIIRPSAYWQFTVVHLVNFLIFLFALAGFEFFLRAAVAELPGVDSSKGINRLPKWAVCGVGYTVFFWTSLGVVGLQLVMPDMLMAGLLFFAMGLLLRIWAQPQNSLQFVYLGGVLGLGYLAKAPVFLLGFIIFGAAWIVGGARRKATPRVLVGLAVFLAVCAPWIVGLSLAKGHFSFGDSARFNYVHHVNGADPVSLGTAGGHYTHPVRQIFDNPPIYEFATPIKGTSPIWYDPSYWTEGAVPRVHLREQWAVIRRWLLFYLESLFEAQLVLLVGFLVLLFAARRNLAGRQILARWPVWLISLMGLGMYVPVHLELRYVAGFITMLWVALFSGLEMLPGSKGRRLVATITIIVAAVMAGPTALVTANELRHTVRRQPHKQWQTAEDLRKLGVKPGDSVARLPAHFGLAWARLLQVRSVAEIPLLRETEFWCGTPENREQTVEKFRGLGITALVAEQANDKCAPGPEWQKIGDGTYYALTFEPGTH